MDLRDIQEIKSTGPDIRIDMWVREKGMSRLIPRCLVYITGNMGVSFSPRSR